MDHLKKQNKDMLLGFDAAFFFTAVITRDLPAVICSKTVACMSVLSACTFLNDKLLLLLRNTLTEMTVVDVHFFQLL